MAEQAPQSRQQNTSILEEAIEVTEERENVHGSIVETHHVIAEFWSVYLRAITGYEIHLNASHAADMLDLFKDGRKATGERDRDTYRDAAGYNHCAWVCREAELAHTRALDTDLRLDTVGSDPDDGDDE